MKPVYRCAVEGVCASALVTRHNERYAITGLSVFPVHLRNKGYGREVMNMIIADADKQQVTLTLFVGPFDERKCDMDKFKLEAWYRRLGFEGHAQRMVRLPNKPPNTKR